MKAFCLSTSVPWKVRLSLEHAWEAEGGATETVELVLLVFGTNCSGVILQNSLRVMSEMAEMLGFKRPCEKGKNGFNFGHIHAKTLKPFNVDQGGSYALNLGMKVFIR